MKKILIIGGGFAGFSALFKLGRYKGLIDVSLIDKKKEFNFLPVLPDIVGRKINPDFLSNNLEDICKKMGSKFINDEVLSLDLVKRAAYTQNVSILYDYLLIASGSETNFYGNVSAKTNSYKLDSVSDTVRVLDALNNQGFSVFIISGGGYTGIEIATNIKRHLIGLKLNKRVIIVEKAPNLLGPLPDWMKKYVCDNLNRLGIEFLTNTEISSIDKDKMILSNGEAFDKAMLIWTAGVKTGEFIEKLTIEKNRQGRIKVDKYLRLSGSCFVAGDAVLFSYKGKDLRMAIQFAIAQGDIAAINILNSIQNKQLKAYKPVDLGYIIPMANNKSCGTVLGLNVKGVMPTFLHYFMCAYRSYGNKNKIGIIKDLITGGAK